VSTERIRISKLTQEGNKYEKEGKIRDRNFNPSIRI
jgi:hypothetical protein